MVLCCVTLRYAEVVTILFIILCVFVHPLTSQDTSLINRNDCELTSRNNALLVSLMNGEVRALNIDTGALLWGIHTGHKLLSSSISSLEVIYNGMPTRLVPSLDGSLFRFHDDSFEPLPFSAETLLSSSFKLPGDSTVVGSKELRTVGVNPTCGDVYYKCDKEGCERVEQNNLHEKDVLVVKHLTHTVRAASIRNGEEKWNFSVGYHELSFLEADVPLYTAGSETDCGDAKVKFSVPDGVVIRLNDEKEKLWEYQFGAPVARAWILSNGHLDHLDLLDPKYLMINERISGVDEENTDDNQPPPSLYIGVFEKQVYLQPSPRLQKNVSAIGSLYQRGAKKFSAVPQVKWAPYITSSPSRTPWLNYGKSDPNKNPSKESSKPAEGNAVSVFNPTMDYPYDQGFYLITQEEEETVEVEGEEQELNSTYFDEFDRIMVVQMVSLTYYWREVLAISIIFAVILNGILYMTRAHRRKLQTKLKCLGGTGDASEVSEVSDVSEDDKKFKKKKKKAVKEAEVAVPPPQPQYLSRYKSDFTHMQCLGKGGFGVVFHARNTLDERDYAIKRIPLPNSDEAKEKVVREVKALAMLDHPNIVRYFQSWFETPPPGWQEDQDKIWETSERLLPTPMNSGCPLNISESYKGAAAKGKDSDFFIPKLRLDDSNMSDGSFGFPMKNAEEDSLDIVFTSRSGETSVSANQPFHKYAVAPAELDNDHPDSDSEWDQLEDSGYHKNRLVLVEATESFDDDDTIDSESSKPPVSSCATSQLSRKPEESQSKLFLYIQMQLCKKETLREYLNANTLYRDRNEILLTFRQICDAVEYIHSQGLIHRDLKPTNIFFSAENTIKVGDFGLVTALSTDAEDENTVMDRTLPAQVNLTNNVGTQLYMSPEQVARRQYNNKVDIYALGLLFFELKYPFSTVMERVYTMQGIKRQKYPERFVRELNKEYKFIKWMLTRNPARRPTISEVLHSDVMSGSDALVQADRRTRTISRSSSGNDA